MNILNKETRKKNRKFLVDYLYNLLIKTGISKNLLCFSVKSIHFALPLIVLIGYMLFPLNYVHVITVIITFFSCLYIYLDGCFLSILEFKLDKTHDVNIIDPYLSLYDVAINRENRINGTKTSIFFFYLIVSFVLYIRLKLRYFN